MKVLFEEAFKRLIVVSVRAGASERENVDNLANEVWTLASAKADTAFDEDDKV